MVVKSHNVKVIMKKFNICIILLVEFTHPARRCYDDVIMTSFCTSHWRRRSVPNETPNDISVERRQDVSVIRLHDVLLVCRDDVSWRRNDNVPTTSQTSLKWNTQWRLSGTSPRCLSGTYLLCRISTSLQRLL